MGKYGKGDGWMDEMGYISGAQTCIFGPGYEDVVNLLPTTKLMSVKISNNTNSYTGDMGLWEINAAPLPADLLTEIVCLLRACFCAVVHRSASCVHLRRAEIALTFFHFSCMHRLGQDAGLFQHPLYSRSTLWRRSRE